MSAATDAASERNMVALTAIACISTRVFEVMYPTLAVTMASDLRVPVEQVLGWSFFGYVLLGFGVLPAGLLADRLGPRRALVVAIAGMGVSALAAAETSRGTSIAACLAAMGLCGSVSRPAGMRLISQTASAPERASRISDLCGHLAMAMTPMLTAMLCIRFGWQTACAIIGFGMCSAAVLCALLPVEAGEGPAAVFSDATADANSAVGSLSFALLCTVVMLAGISYRANLLVQPAYFAEHVSGVGFGAAASLVLAFGVLGQYGGVMLASRYDLRRLYYGAHVISLPALLAMAYFAGPPMVAAAVLFTAASFAIQPIEQRFFPSITPARWRMAGRMRFLLRFGVSAVAVGLPACGQARGDLRIVFLYLAGLVTTALVVLSILVASSGNGAPRKVSTRWAVNGGPWGA